MEIIYSLCDFFSLFIFIKVVEEVGGRVMCRANVEEIIVDEQSLCAIGVRVCGVEIRVWKSY
jgi:hypothetical protein